MYDSIVELLERIAESLENKVVPEVAGTICVFCFDGENLLHRPVVAWELGKRGEPLTPLICFANRLGSPDDMTYEIVHGEDEIGSAEYRVWLRLLLEAGARVRNDHTLDASRIDNDNREWAIKIIEDKFRGRIDPNWLVR
jgi:hypothetical protein